MTATTFPARLHDFSPVFDTEEASRGKFLEQEMLERPVHRDKNGIRLLETKKPEPLIVTHKHPVVRGYASDDPRSRGVSFSCAEWRDAYQSNVSEMRATSPGYRYTVTNKGKKPTAKEVATFTETIERINQSVRTEFEEQIKKLEDLNDYVGAADTARIAEAEHWHEVSKRISAEPGWTYERQRI